jgi:hypothetical protein
LSPRHRPQIEPLSQNLSGFFCNFAVRGTYNEAG